MWLGTDLSSSGRPRARASGGRYRRGWGWGVAMRRIRSITLTSAIVGVVAAMLALATTPALATATIVQADYEMNEPAGSAVMTDTGPNQVNGPIGTVVQTGVVVNGATAYRWSNVNPTAPPANPQRLVQVDNQSLNP